MDKLILLFQDIAKLWAKSGPQYLRGALSTIELAVAATAIGLLIGLFCGILQTIPSSKDDNIVKRIVLKIVKAVVRIYVEVFRGTPMILQAVFIYFAIPYFTNNAVVLNVIPASYLVVSINTGAYMAETVRAYHVVCTAFDTAELYIRYNTSGNSHAVGECVPSGVLERFFRSHIASFDLSVHEGMVLGEDAELLTELVYACISDVEGHHV